MELLIGAAIYALVIQKLWTAARTDHELAKQGIISPRLQARHGANAAAMRDKYGFLDHLRDAWRDYWPRRTEALIAARDAKAANPGEKVSLRDRLAAGKAVIIGATKKVATSPLAQKLINPVGEKKSADVPVVEPIPEPAAPVVDPEVGTVRFTDTGRERWNGTDWEPPPEPAKPAQTLAPSTGGTMSAPTGEAINYNTTVVELDATDRKLANMLDQAQSGLRGLRTAAEGVEALEGERRPLAASTIGIKENLEVLSLDSTTMSGVDSACEALDANAMSALLGMLEQSEQQFRHIIGLLEAAQAGVAASKANVIGTYGGSADVVEQTGINAQFLDSGAARTTGNGGAGTVSEAMNAPSGLERDLRTKGLGDSSSLVAPRHDTDPVNAR